VIEDLVRALAPGELEPLGRAAGAEDHHAERPRDLDGGQTDAAARPVDQHGLPAAGVGVMAKRVIRSAVRDPEPGALRKRGPVRQRVDL
jgi:hypothetical protein